MLQGHLRSHPEDEKVLKPFLVGFDVSRGYEWTKAGNRLSAYYLKPEPSMASFLGAEREILLVYSPHNDLQVRAITARDDIIASDRQRLDPLGTVLVADATTVRKRVQEYLQRDPELAPIVGLSTSELGSVRDIQDLKRIIAQQFFTRDLFALESPLRQDALFFGRQALVAELVDRVRAGQNSGLFGLRRMGKTSVLFALGRRIEADGLGTFAYVDVQLPSLWKGRWRDLLQVIVRTASAALPEGRVPRTLGAEKLTYSEDKAAYHFHQDIARILEVAPSNRLFVALDEVENITFDLSPAAHWQSDFLPFWQTMRSVHQQLNESFCFAISGVNPRALEAAQIGTHQNPLFGTVGSYFLAPFSQPETREMVRRLARSMGLTVEEGLYPELQAHYGGHPFLTRQACSLLAKKVSERPGRLTKALFEREDKAITATMAASVQHILAVLATWYPEEYEALVDVVLGRSSEPADPVIQRHLFGYGFLSPAGKGIQIGLVARVLEGEAKRRGPGTTAGDSPEEIQAEISRRRNPVERKLRVVLAQALLFKYGKKAGDRLMQAIPSERRQSLLNPSYREVWKELYLVDLISVLDREWELVAAWFGVDKAEVLQWLRQINITRIDAHDGTASKDELAFTRVCFDRLEGHLEQVPGLSS